MYLLRHFNASTLPPRRCPRHVVLVVHSFYCQRVPTEWNLAVLLPLPSVLERKKAGVVTPPGSRPLFEGTTHYSVTRLIRFVASFTTIPSFRGR